MKTVIAAGKFAGTYRVRLVCHCPDCREDRPGTSSSTGRTSQCGVCGRIADRSKGVAA